MIVEGARCRVEGRDVRVGETEGQPEEHSANRQQHFSPVACLRDTPTVNYTAGNTLALSHSLGTRFFKRASPSTARLACDTTHNREVNI